MGYSPERTPAPLPHGYFDSWGARGGSPAASWQTLRVAAAQQLQGTWAAADLLSAAGAGRWQEPGFQGKTSSSSDLFLLNCQ